MTPIYEIEGLTVTWITAANGYRRKRNGNSRYEEVLTAKVQIMRVVKPPTQLPGTRVIREEIYSEEEKKLQMSWGHTI